MVNTIERERRTQLHVQIYWAKATRWLRGRETLSCVPMHAYMCSCDELNSMRWRIIKIYSSRKETTSRGSEHIHNSITLTGYSIYAFILCAVLCRCYRCVLIQCTKHIFAFPSVSFLYLSFRSTVQGVSFKFSIQTRRTQRMNETRKRKRVVCEGRATPCNMHTREHLRCNRRNTKKQKKEREKYCRCV